MPKPKTYPHSEIEVRCKEKYPKKWDVMECVLNSLQLYYGKTTRERCRVYVEVEPYPTTE